MNTHEALTFAIERLEGTQRTLQRVLEDPRRPREQTAADIERYAAAIETLVALDEHIAGLTARATHR
jgi:hypothetical protein